MLTAILATDRRGIIGHHGKIPWHIPQDLEHFRETTWNRPVLMGRRTFESLGRWLPSRQHLILTRQASYNPVAIFGPPPATSDYRVIGEEDLATLQGASQEIFVAGGAEIYTLTMPMVTKILWTFIRADVDGDAKVDMSRMLRWTPQILKEGMGAGLPFSIIRLTPP